MRLPSLVGAAEIQEMLGGNVTRQRVQQIVTSESFPRPVLRLRMGKAWLKADVEAWIKAHRPQR